MTEEIIPLSFEKSIYKNLHIRLATFLGGPLGATWLLAENFKNLGHPEKVRKTWIWGILASILLVVISFLIPDNSKGPSFLLPVICIVIASQVAKATQGDEIKQHLSEGGATYSVWRSLGIGLICMIITLAIILGISSISSNPFGSGQ
jgi:peptidoglycan/LPS O-acetylase OafA/YrhL